MCGHSHTEGSGLETGREILAEFPCLMEGMVNKKIQGDFFKQEGGGGECSSSHHQRVACHLEDLSHR